MSSVVGDSQISLILCRRQVLAAIQLAGAVVSYIISSLPCPETDWNICIGQQGYVFILTDFKRDVFMFHS